MINHNYSRQHYSSKEGTELYVFDNFLTTNVFQAVLGEICEFDSQENKEVAWPWATRYQALEKSDILFGKKCPLPPTVYQQVEQDYQQDLKCEKSLYYWYHFLGFKNNQNGTSDSPIYIQNHPDFVKKETLMNLYDFITSKNFKSFVNSNTVHQMGNQTNNASFSLTKYDFNTFLSPHTDYVEDNYYELTFILYFSESKPINGDGQLMFRIDDKWLQIDPAPNRAVIFKPTTKTEHFVKKTTSKNNKRYAISGWFVNEPT